MRPVVHGARPGGQDKPVTVRSIRRRGCPLPPRESKRPICSQRLPGTCCGLTRGLSGLVSGVVGAVTGLLGSASASLIDEIVREGARRMLAEALQAEVAAYIERFADELDERGRRLVVRNGSRRGARGLLGSGLDSRRGLPETRHVRNLPTS